MTIRRSADVRYWKVANTALTPSFLAAVSRSSTFRGEIRSPFRLAIGFRLRLICLGAARLGPVRPSGNYVTGERFVTMAGIGQGWIEEAIPTRDGAPKPAALLLGSILLLTSP
jgi:hypothetical protein